MDFYKKYKSVAINLKGGFYLKLTRICKTLLRVFAAHFLFQRKPLHPLRFPCILREI
jgi:hypothetical protein